MIIYIYNNSDEIREQYLKDKNTINIIINKIKNGDKELRETFIGGCTGFILKVVSKCVRKHIDIQSDEYSIGLEAFDNSIDIFNSDRKVNFFTFAGLIIKRKIIDFERKNGKLKKVLPFSYFEDKSDIEDHIFGIEEISINIDDSEEIENIMKYEKQLEVFKIKIEDLSNYMPKHKDSIQLCVKLARIIANDDKMFNSLIRTKNIPRNDIMNSFQVHRRTLENNRKIIIAICLMIKSNLELSKKFLNLIEEGRWYD